MVVLTFFSKFPPSFCWPALHIPYSRNNYVYKAWILSFLCDSAKLFIHLVRIFRTDGRRAISPAASDQARPISHIVFPRYQAGAVTALKRVPRVEAFARMMEQCVSIHKPLTLEDAVALAHWIERVQSFDLVAGSLDDMMERIDGMRMSA